MENPQQQVQITLDNPEIAYLLSQILSTVAHSTATLVINIFSSPALTNSQTSGSSSSDEDAYAASILGIPHERKYNEVRIYINERARFDAAFKNFFETHSRVELCQRLSVLFDWTVEAQQLGRNMNRNR